MKTVVIIQARMGSTRLPGKVLKPLGNRTVIEYVVERCQQFMTADVIVATSTLASDDRIVEWCLNNQVPYFRGSEEDVLDRYIECAALYSPDYVIRVTADCPFVDFEMAKSIQQIMRQRPSDFVAVRGTLPRGLESEMVSLSALQYMNHHGKEQRHREHVTYYAKEYSDLFKITEYYPDVLVQHPELRITIDTEEDYKLCQIIAQHFHGDMLVPSREVVRYLLENPEVAMINAHVEQKLVV
ncbi:cytidylyltransferase domain-containing protein [Paenibacillus albus]|uniref:Acylneuraminate cytidylyltransferase n=1 Tax=Paenibacillus albus TaxID=2495582 RepID=A0A3S8ZYH4_9BACL|nr:glycosyltransferase family protein [Paenibacillus albus]AZN38496.1 acylneuraminate cytidylyltransferase [Paenibacillus albus]